MCILLLTKASVLRRDRNKPPKNSVLHGVLLYGFRISVAAVSSRYLALCTVLAHGGDHVLRCGLGSAPSALSRTRVRAEPKQRPL